MQVRVNCPMPEPLAELNKSDETIWKQNSTLKTGKFYALVAPSGKGKSTFIHILYGKRNDFTGEVFWDERDVKKIKPAEWADMRSQKISVVFQDLRLFYDLSGMENIQIKNKLTNHLREQEINTYAEQLGIAHVLNKACKFMSFGERQRVAIIRSLAQPFEWILLDEPFSHLDKSNARIAAGLITDACKKNNASLIAASLGVDDFFEYDEILNV